MKVEMYDENTLMSTVNKWKRIARWWGPYLGIEEQNKYLEQRGKGRSERIEETMVDIITPSPSRSSGRSILSQDRTHQQYN